MEVAADEIYVRSGSIYTSAGTTAGMDLALALVEEDLGHDVAVETARLLVMFLNRPGGQPQLSRKLSAQADAAGPLGGVVEWIIEHLGYDLRVEVLAARARMSPRNFARTFVRQLCLTPAKFIEAARLERARSCLTSGRGSLKEIAAACGLGSDERMRRAFLRAFQVSPEHYREARLREAVRPQQNWRFPGRGWTTGARCCGCPSDGGHRWDETNRPEDASATVSERIFRAAFRRKLAR